jgi:hypothetical protein
MENVLRTVFTEQGGSKCKEGWQEALGEVEANAKLRRG